MDRLQQQMDFILEIDKEKNILRQTHLSGHGRRENDAEHAWHMAIMAYLLREHANEPVDILKVILMCLIHDVVEIDAGDAYAYDPAALASQKEREDRAKERIYSLLPPDQKEALIALFDEFEANEPPRGPLRPRHGQLPAPAAEPQQQRRGLAGARGHRRQGLRPPQQDPPGVGTAV